MNVLPDEAENALAIAGLLRAELDRLRTEGRELVKIYDNLARRWHRDNTGFIGNHPIVGFDECYHPDCIAARETIARYSQGE